MQRVKADDTGEAGGESRRPFNFCLPASPQVNRAPVRFLNLSQYWDLSIPKAERLSLRTPHSAMRKMIAG